MRISRKMRGFLREVKSAPGDTFSDFSPSLISLALSNRLVRAIPERYPDRRLRECALWITDKGAAAASQETDEE